jgi:hypothetical protein
LGVGVSRVVFKESPEVFPPDYSLYLANRIV